jgi:uncharacterized membrane protein YcjF (UPF0283 family)
MLTNTDLMQIFDFTEDDLEANRAGRISARQVDRLRRRSKITFTCGMLLTMAITCLGIVTVAAAYSGNPVPGLGSADAPGIILVVFVILIGVTFVRAMTRWNTTRADIRKRVSTSAEGIAQAKRISSWIATSYVIEVNSRRFAVSVFAYEALKKRHAGDLERLTSRVYFAPHSKRILALEILESPES